MKLGIVGSRRRDDYATYKLIEKKVLELTPTLIISGGCPKGADRHAEDVARSKGFSILIHYPNKRKLPANPQRYDYTRINYARNEKIARDCDVLLAAPADDRRGGTEHTIRCAEKLGKRVVLV